MLEFLWGGQSDCEKEHMIKHAPFFFFEDFPTLATTSQKPPTRDDNNRATRIDRESSFWSFLITTLYHLGVVWVVVTELVKQVVFSILFFVTFERAGSYVARLLLSLFFLLSQYIYGGWLQYINMGGSRSI